MKILETLNAACKEQGLAYVIVGGHAVAARGYARTTHDLDLAVPAAQRDQWRQVFLQMGYKVYHEQSAFMQFSVPDLGCWPVDLMLLDDVTFAKVRGNADVIQLGAEKAPVASVLHLIFMKLHTLKTGPAERFARDLADILELLKLQGLSPEDSAFRDMCEKYATLEIHERIVQICSKE